MAIKVVKYEFPYLSVEVTVSSGTYVRTLFSDFAAHLGTIGSLVSLVRTQVGKIQFGDSLKMKDWPKEKKFSYEQGCFRPDEVVELPEIHLTERHSKLYSNGVVLRRDQFQGQEGKELFWVYSDERKLLGIGKTLDIGLKAQLNFAASSS